MRFSGMPVSVKGTVQLDPRSLRDPRLAAILLAAVGAHGLLGQTTTPRPELILQAGHADRILAVACSADGRWLASASADKTIILWETATGREARVLAGHTGAVTGIAFTPDGSRLVSDRKSTRLNSSH